MPNYNYHSHLINVNRNKKPVILIKPIFFNGYSKRSIFSAMKKTIISTITTPRSFYWMTIKRGMLSRAATVTKKGAEIIAQNSDKIAEVAGITTTTKLGSNNTASQPVRSCASATAGNFPQTSDIVTNPVTDAGTPIQGDLTTVHKNIVTTSCEKPECAKTNCADSTKSEPNPCGVDPSVHQGPLTDQVGSKFIHEFAETLTHTVPSNMIPIVIDTNNDYKGVHPKGQSAAVEKHTTTLSDNDVTGFQEHGQAKQFVQTNAHTAAIVNGMPSDSNLK